MIGVLLVGGVGYYYVTSSGEPERDTPATYPVSGTVTYNGEGPIGAHVTLHKLPLAKDSWDAIFPRGRIEQDGSFQIQTFNEDDGAPPGEYAVTLSWKGFADPTIRPGVDRWKGKYDNPRKPLQTISVVDSEVLMSPIELKGPAIRVSDPVSDGPRG